ncbi:MAG: UDP-N-acetylmuramoyl-tripeptide--D-alanyl-D-alanine ligase [Nitriliruptoraceae bacterium]
MIPLTIADIARITAGQAVPARRSTASHVSDDHRGRLAEVVVARQIDTVTADSRTVGGNPADGDGGTLFVALRTETGDGHDHVTMAFDNGAAVALVECDPHLVSAVSPGALPSSADTAMGEAGANSDVPLSEDGVPALVIVPDTWKALRQLASEVRRRVNPAVVAITGSVGKTTVKDLTAAIVARSRRTYASPASFNNELGVPLTVLGMPGDCQALICEIGARAPGDVAVLADVVRPDVAVVTSVVAAHLGPFGSLDAIAATKGELVRSLGSDGIAVLNLDNSYVAAMAAGAPSVIGISTQHGSTDVTPRRVTMRDDARAEVVIDTPWGVVECVLPVAGRHQVVNAMLAIGVAGALGIDTADMSEGLSEAKVSHWRGQLLSLGGGITVIDDAYNANPASVEAALDTLVTVARSRRTVAVLGEMAELGPASEQAHRQIGASCARRGVDHVVAVGPGAHSIAWQARSEGHQSSWMVNDATAAQGWLDEHLEAGDVVLVKASRVVALDRVVTHLRSIHPPPTTHPSGAQAQEHAS